jgi:hypothetical protein
MTSRTQAVSAAVSARVQYRAALAAAVAALSLTAASGAQAAAFINGSFESPGTTPVRMELAEGSTFVTGWTSHGAGNFYESNGFDGIDASDGTHWVAFGHSSNEGGSLSQTFSTVLNALYTLNYDFRLQQGLDTHSAFQVSASSGESVNSGIATGAWTGGTALTFTGTGGNVTLTFTDLTPDGQGEGSNLALDNLRLSSTGGTTGGVPEPMSWAMMILGFGGVGGVLRRRRELAAAA